MDDYSHTYIHSHTKRHADTERDTYKHRRDTQTHRVIFTHSSSELRVLVFAVFFSAN